jgi:hypothetical protein
VIAEYVRLPPIALRRRDPPRSPNYGGTYEWSSRTDRQFEPYPRSLGTTSSRHRLDGCGRSDLDQFRLIDNAHQRAYCPEREMRSVQASSDAVLPPWVSRSPLCTCQVGIPLAGRRTKSGMYGRRRRFWVPPTSDAPGGLDCSALGHDTVGALCATSQTAPAMSLLGRSGSNLLSHKRPPQKRRYRG